MCLYQKNLESWWRHQMETFSALLALCEGLFTGHRWIPRTKANEAELWCFLWSTPWINGWSTSWINGWINGLRQLKYVSLPLFSSGRSIWAVITCFISPITYLFSEYISATYNEVGNTFTSLGLLIWTVVIYPVLTHVNLDKNCPALC